MAMVAQRVKLGVRDGCGLDAPIRHGLKGKRELPGVLDNYYSGCALFALGKHQVADGVPERDR